ncbi:hypothetical protein LCGC14_2559120 [marine sediment metagenome]|uniref:Uncharacterized protein n=1 Tax=marine sediment metagenome TaxID=412755 RepID=A0A0F9B8G1_9ZZZZ
MCAAVNETMKDLSSRGVWPFTWCEVHFAGAVEEMTGCLVWRAKMEVVNEVMAAEYVLVFEDPDCVLVQRLLVDREAIDREAIGEVLRGWEGISGLVSRDSAVHAVVDAVLGRRDG